MSDAALIAIDWGTTSARAYRLDRGGRVLSERSASLGIQQVRDGAFDAALTSLLGDWGRDPAPRLACGMIGSRQGWVEAPYAACPADLAALAKAIVRTPRGELSVVPGVLCRDANGIPDVMRGEETQLAGAIAPDEERVFAVLPGTHSKWARVERGRIVEFLSFMTGELYAVLMAHSILGRMADATAGGGGPGPAFARGVERGLGSGGLAHDIFGARTLALFGELAPPEVGDWLSGVLIGREIRNARTWALRGGHDASNVRVIGSDALVTRYMLALDRADVTVTRGPDAAAARGLWRIAAHAGIVPEYA